jgi:hypothetical protein
MDRPLIDKLYAELSEYKGKYDRTTARGGASDYAHYRYMAGVSYGIEFCLSRIQEILDAASSIEDEANDGLTEMENEA